MMKNMYSLVALAVAFALVSCKDVPTDANTLAADVPTELLGHWRYFTTTITEPGMDIPVTLCIAGYIDLESDGTWTQDLRIGGEDISPGPGTWTADSSAITLTPRRGKVEVWHYHLNDDGAYYLLSLDAGAGEAGRRISYQLDRSR